MFLFCASNGKLSIGWLEEQDDHLMMGSSLSAPHASLDDTRSLLLVCMFHIVTLCRLKV